MDGSRLQVLLMERADRTHEYLERRVPLWLRDSVSPDDLLQEVWLAAFRGISGFRSDRPAAFDRWLTRIAERKILDAIRDARRAKRRGACRAERAGRRHASSYLDLFACVAANQRTPSSEDAAREAVHAVQIAVAGLPEDYRCAIAMHHIEGRSRAEIANALQRTPPAVNGLLYRGLQMLRERIGAAGKYFSDGG